MYLDRAFTDLLKGNDQYIEALEIVQENNAGKTWLIGGFVYRNLAYIMYDAPRPSVDLDFIVEEPLFPLLLPGGWQEGRNRFDNPKLLGEDGREIDFVPLNNIKGLLDYGYESTIDNYLKINPLSIQSIVYDVDEEKLIGEKGLQALKDRVIEVHNPFFARLYEQKKEKPLIELMKEKAQSMRFHLINPSV